jgi:hypothetical protein
MKDLALRGVAQPMFSWRRVEKFNWIVAVFFAMPSNGLTLP